MKSVYFVTFRRKITQLCTQHCKRGTVKPHQILKSKELWDFNFFFHMCWCKQKRCLSGTVLLTITFQEEKITKWQNLLQNFCIYLDKFDKIYYEICKALF